MALDIGIIGGGISGLASASRLSGLGHRLTLFEGDDVLGGLGTTFPYRDGHLERFYHCLLPDDHALLAHLRDLGIEREILWKHTAMGFMYQRRIWPLNTPLDLLRFGALTPIERLRMGLLGLRARAGGLDPHLDRVTAADWVRQQVGTRAFDVLWKPLLSAKIGDHYAALPALWLTSRMHREKSAPTETKGCLPGGYRSLIGAFEQRLRERGVALRMRTRVRAIERVGERMGVRLEDGTLEVFDSVIATSPLPQFQRMTAGLGLDPKLAGLQLDYQGVMSGVFLTRQPLTRYYWMPWVDSGATSQGVIEMSNLVPLERAGGLHVNYLVNYTHRDSALFQQTDEQVLALYRRDLASLFPAAAGSVVDAFLFRAPFVEPMWTVGYRQVRPPTSVVPGRLYLVCTAQVYPRVNSWNSCCEVADEMAQGFIAETAGLAAAGARA